MIPALNKISTQQLKPTAHTISKFNRLIDNAETYSNTVIQYQESYMIMHGDIDAAYLVLPKYHSRIAGHLYLIYHPPNTTPKPKLNSPIITVCQTLKMFWPHQQGEKQDRYSSTDKKLYPPDTLSSPWTTRNQRMDLPSSCISKPALEPSTCS